MSRPLDDVVAEVAGLAAGGVREVTFLGQNVNAYRGASQDGTVADLALLVRCAAELEGIGRIRFTTSHPAEMTDSLLGAFREVPALVGHLHLPVQSGSDRVLASMKRGYTSLEFLSIIRRLRGRVAVSCFSTNLARIESIAHAAAAAGLAGRTFCR